MIDYVAGGRLGGTDQVGIDPQGTTTQESPAIARLQAGGFVVSYIDDRAVMVQRYDADGKKVGPLTALTDGGSETMNFNPSVTGLATGGYAISWVDEDSHVVVQVFDAAGQQTTDIFGVGGATNYQNQPAIAGLTNGDFVVTWVLNGSPGTIHARIFHASGQPAASEFVVAAAQFANSFFPQIAPLAGGGFVIAWSGDFDEEGGGTVRGQAYDEAGAPQGTVVRIDNEPGDNFYESVAGLASGQYVLTWTTGDSSSSLIMAQICDVTGAKIGEAFQVNTDTSHAAGQSRVTALDNGGFLVTWRLDVPGDGPNYFQIGDLKGQAFDGSGNQVGEEFLVNQVTHAGQDLPAVTAFGIGDVAVVWRSFDEFQDTQDTNVETRTFYSTVTGTAGANALTGAVGVDILRGLDGNDSLNGLSGPDLLVGGRGHDTYHVDNVGDRTIEARDEGTDTVRSSVSFVLGAAVENLILTGSAPIDGTGNSLANILTGNNAANRLGGGDGQDTLDGRIGADLLVGGAGHDLYFVDNIGDQVVEAGQGGTDTVQSMVDFALPTHVERLVLTGSSGIDGRGNTGANRITGNGGSNFLNGGQGDDVIEGAGGADRLYGMEGVDSLVGGAGDDSFFFNVAPGAANADRILDFVAADDRFSLARYAFAGIGPNGTLAVGAFRLGSAAGDASDRIVYHQATGQIFFDPDGTGATGQLQFATVTAGTALTHVDFVIYS